MKRSLLPLNALRAFDAAARHRSFKLAADDLAVTPAAISQQIRTLEDYIGVTLFRRSNRELILTDAAKASLQPLTDGFSKLEEAVAALETEKESAMLRVSVSPSFASKWLVPRLARYYERRPNAVVKISATMAITDFQSEEVDIAIRYGTGQYEKLYVEELLRETVVPMCAPGLLDGDKPLKTPEDLIKHTLIHDDSFSEDDSATTWPMWLKAAAVVVPEGLPALHFNTHMLAIEAAVAGRGVVLARSSIAEEDVKAGRLVPLFVDTRLPVSFAHYIVVPEDHLTRETVADFVDWLRAETAIETDAAPMFS